MVAKRPHRGALRESDDGPAPDIGVGNNDVDSDLGTCIATGQIAGIVRVC
jgi:hypothetical protein